MLNGIIIFVGLLLITVVLFGFLLKKEYQWIKATQMQNSKLKQIVAILSWLITGVIGIAAVLILGFFLVLGVAMEMDARDQAKIVNLNEGAAPLKIGETWVIADKGSITVTAFTELSDEALQERYGKTPSETQKYYEIAFDYENIAFDGYLKEKQLIENDLCFYVYISSEDMYGEIVEAWLDTYGEIAWLDTYGEKAFYYAPRGSIVRDNRFLVVVDEVEDTQIIEISFTILTPDKYERYRQDFLYEVLRPEPNPEEK